MGIVIPQLIRTLRNPRLAGVSATSWTITMCACFTWLVYGIKGGVLPQIPGNVLILLAAESSSPGRRLPPLSARALLTGPAWLRGPALLSRPAFLGGSPLLSGRALLGGGALSGAGMDASGSYLASDMLNVCCAEQTHDPRFTVTDPAARGIRLQAADDVAITTADVTASTLLDLGGQQVLLRDDVRAATSWRCATSVPGTRSAGTAR